jgi:hypothetical protein
VRRVGADYHRNISVIDAGNPPPFLPQRPRITQAPAARAESTVSYLLP